MGELGPGSVDFICPLVRVALGLSRETQEALALHGEANQQVRIASAMRSLERRPRATRTPARVNPTGIGR